MLDSIGQILPCAAASFGDRTALTIEGRAFSFAALDALSNKLAQGLIRLGIAPGDRVTLYGANSWEWIVGYYGISKTGAVINPINVMLTPEEVRYVVEDCGAKAVLASADVGRRILGIEKDSPVEALILFGEEPPEEAVSFRALLEENPSDDQTVEVAPEALSTICYTSGTTGRPKGAMLSHRAVLLNASMTALMHGRSTTDTVVTALPCAHVYGNVVMNGAMLTGMTLVLHERFDEKAILDSIQKHRASMFEGVPTMYMFLLNQALESWDLSSFRCCTVGGQTMPEAKMREVERRFGCPLIEVWGMTEIAGVGTTLTHNGPRVHGSVGVALPHNEIRIADAEDARKTLPAGEVGELMFRGPLVMQGYFGNEEATRETIEPDGWLHSGDLARMDEDGCAYVVDRKKDMILTAGYNVYPAELERVIAAHPDVALVAVGRIPNPEKGELAKAYIIAREGAEPSADSILAHCREHLAAYKVPRAVQFVDDLPRTSTGKIMRRELRGLDHD